MVSVFTIETLADLLDELGGIPPHRVRFRPFIGTATEEDVLRIESTENRLCELVEGVLVEKAMGYIESILAGAILSYLRSFVVPRNLGHISGEAGMMKLFPGLVRIPDVAFASWQSFPDGQLPTSPIPELAPDLVVEVLSAGNTPREMARKRREYFDAGVRLVWIVDPRSRCVTVYESTEDGREFAEGEILEAGDVLPGFSLDLGGLFSELDRVARPQG